MQYMLVVVREKLSLDEDSDLSTTSLCISLLCPVCTGCFARNMLMSY